MWRRSIPRSCLCACLFVVVYASREVCRGRGVYVCFVFASVGVCLSAGVSAGVRLRVPVLRKECIWVWDGCDCLVEDVPKGVDAST